MSNKPVWTAKWQQQDVEIKQDQQAYDGFYKIRKWQLRHRCFSGDWSPWLVREQIRRQDAAAVLLFDPKHHKIVLVEQIRYGVLGVYPDHSPWLCEIVAGLIDPGEEPEQTVHREALEEANCKINKLIHIGDFYNSPGGFAEKTYLYCGLVDVEGIGGIGGLRNHEEHEDLMVHVLPAKQVLDLLEQDFMTSSSTYIALQWLAKAYLEKKFE